MIGRLTVSCGDAYLTRVTKPQLETSVGSLLLVLFLKVVL